MCVTYSETAKRRVMGAWLLCAGTSEGWNLAYVDDWEGGLNLASTINLNWVTQNQTAMIVWNLIYSFYSILPFAHPDDRDPVAGMGHGLMTAAEKFQPSMGKEAYARFAESLISESFNNWRTRTYDCYQKCCLGIL